MYYRIELISSTNIAFEQEKTLTILETNSNTYDSECSVSTQSATWITSTLSKE